MKTFTYSEEWTIPIGEYANKRIYCKIEYDLDTFNEDESKHELKIRNKVVKTLESRKNVILNNLDAITHPEASPKETLPDEGLNKKEITIQDVREFLTIFFNVKDEGSKDKRLLVLHAVLSQLNVSNLSKLRPVQYREFIVKVKACLVAENLCNEDVPQ